MPEYTLKCVDIRTHIRTIRAYGRRTVRHRTRNNRNNECETSLTYATVHKKMK